MHDDAAQETIRFACFEVSGVTFKTFTCFLQHVFLRGEWSKDADGGETVHSFRWREITAEVRMDQTYFGGHSYVRSLKLSTPADRDMEVPLNEADFKMVLEEVEARSVREEQRAYYAARDAIIAKLSNKPVADVPTVGTDLL